MSDPGASLEELLQPVAAERDGLIVLRDVLKENLRDVNVRIAAFDKVLKAAHLNGAAPPKEQKKKVKKADPSPEAIEKVLAVVGTQREATSTSVSDATGYTQSYSSKVLVWLRENERIRLLREEPTSANGKGRRPVYAPW